jgi:hypothetical protein
LPHPTAIVQRVWYNHTLGVWYDHTLEIGTATPSEFGAATPSEFGAATPSEFGAATLSPSLGSPLFRHRLLEVFYIVYGIPTLKIFCIRICR